jgi:hypothetical protein
MGILILASILVTLAIVALLFARGGAKETATATAARREMFGATAGRDLPEEPPLTRPRNEPSQAMIDKVNALVAALGLTVETPLEQDGHAAAYIAIGDALGNRQRVYVRAFDLALGQLVPAVEVSNALDFARSEGLHKTILVTTTSFSDEAILAASGTTAELIDGAKLHDMLRAHPSYERS